jgi:glutamate 5-kinase
MITKIEAAKIATASGTHMIIAKGTGEHPLRTLIDGGLHTEFTSSSTPLSARKGWIATSLKTHGKLHLDDGAIKAVISGASLLPVGVHSFEGTFDRGDMVSIMSPSNKEIGRGLIAYSSEDMTMICGQHSSEISHFVGFLGREELIHRDDMVIF